MKIWIIDHYSVPPKYFPLSRNTDFAKKLIAKGHDVIIFAASTVHNSNTNLVKDSLYKEFVDNGIKYVLIKCTNYKGNNIKRIFNMLEFPIKLRKVCVSFEKPDVIISQSMTLHACAQGISLGKKYKCKKIAQITDLWPETIIANGICKKENPIILYLRNLEKWIYKNADKIIFSMEGAYDYIMEQKWDKLIPRKKVSYINNGIDLLEFNRNIEKYQIFDKDLDDDSIYKIIYTGSIRKIYNIGILLDVAKKIKYSNIKILIWGDGDEIEDLKQRLLNERISNVVLKGRIEKKYIPYIVSKAQINIAHAYSTPIFRFGISFNKIFDYMAAGKPVLTTFKCKYNPLIIYGVGFEVEEQSADCIEKMINVIYNLSNNEYEKICNKTKEIAKLYDFNVLTEKLLDVINSNKV